MATVKKLVDVSLLIICESIHGNPVHLQRTRLVVKLVPPKGNVFTSSFASHPMERTLILLKPDAVAGKFCGKVIDRFESAGFTIRGCKMVSLTPAILKEHYAHVADKPFYPEIEKFMSSVPVIALVLEGDDIVAKMRDMLGVTDSRKAAPGTIRADYGTTQMLNVAHASDTPETAKKEIKRFFAETELFDY
jgi:nucleoside-diphosphate kinase